MQIDVFEIIPRSWVRHGKHGCSQIRHCWIWTHLGLGILKKELKKRKEKKRKEDLVRHVTSFTPLLEQSRLTCFLVVFYFSIQKSNGFSHPAWPAHRSHGCCIQLMKTCNFPWIMQRTFLWFEDHFYYSNSTAMAPRWPTPHSERSTSLLLNFACVCLSLPFNTKPICAFVVAPPEWEGL